MRRFLAVTILGFLASGPARSIEETKVERVRRLATTGHRDEAIRLVEKYLAEDDDSDLRTQYGLVLSWEGRWEDARRELRKVLADHPDHGDALPALVNVELWSGHPDKADQLAAEGLRLRPNDTRLMLYRARALRDLSRHKEAQKVLSTLLRVDPGDLEARRFRRNLAEDAYDWHVGIEQTAEGFNDGRRPWSETDIAIKRRTPIGPLTARFSTAERWSIHSRQAEFDLYPHIRSGTYMYCNFGVSPDYNLYPVYRGGAELFQLLGGGWEGSGGFRRLAFDKAKVMIYTSSLGKYWGEWLFVGRTYITPDSLGASHSVHFTARRFFRRAADFVSVRVARGAAQEESRKIGDIETRDAYTVAGELQISLSPRWRLNLHSGHSLEHRAGAANLRRYWGGGGLFFRF